MESRTGPRVVLLFVAIAVGAVALAAAPAAAASGDTHYVDDGTDCPGKDYSTISDAVANATADDTIKVCSGVYQENVTVDKDVTIVAADNATGADAPIVDGSILSSETTAFDVQESGVTIDGLVISNFSADGVAVRGGNSDVAVSNLLIKNVSDSGIDFHGGNNITNVSVDRVIVTEAGGAGLAFSNTQGIEVTNALVNESKTGIRFVPTDNGVVEDVYVHNVSVNTSNTQGIVFDVGDGTTLSDAPRIENVTMTQFEVNESDVDGILIGGANSGVITDVNITEGRLGGSGNARGIRVKLWNESAVTDTRISRVVFDDTHTDSIYVNDRSSGDSDIRVTESLFTDSNSSSNDGDAALRLSETTNPDVVELRVNIIRSGVQHGVINENGSAIFNARQNYWGSDSGPSTPSSASTQYIEDPISGVNASGSGATVSEGSSSGVSNVYFDPWLGKPTCTDPQMVNVSSQLFDFPTVDGVSTAQLLPICAWERAMLPLRADDADAHTNVALPTTYFGTQNEYVNANRRTLSAYQQGESVGIDFENTDGAQTGSFANDDYQLLVVRANQLSALDALGGDATFDRANYTAVLSSDDVQVSVAETGTLDSSGDLHTSYTPSDSGAYGFVLVRKNFGDGVGVTNSGNVTINGGVDVLGVEAIAVQQTDSTATATNAPVDPGESVTFDVNSNLGAGATNHTVVIYNESRLKDETLDIIVDVPASDIAALNFGEQDLTVETSIDAFEGVFNVTGSTTVFGVDVSAQRTSGEVSTADLLAAALPDAQFNDKSGSRVVLPTSATVVAGGTADDTVTVETLPSIPNGTYEYVHVAQKGDAFSTDKGTITVGTDSGTAPPTSPPTSPPSNPPTSPPPSPPTTPDTTVNVTHTEDGVIVVVKNPGVSKRIEIDLGEGNETAPLRVQRIGVTPAAGDDFTMDVRHRTDAPAGTPALDTAGGSAFGYLNVSHSQPDSAIASADFRFRVRKSALDDSGLASDDVALYRYKDGSWTELSTRLAEETGSHYVYEADSPGLSVFAAGASQDAAVSVTGASLARTTITAGESVDVTATVENAGDSERTATVDLTVDGIVVDSREVTVPAGGSQEITFTRTFDDAGSYEVAVGGVGAGTLTVEAASGDTSTPPPTSSPEGPEGGNFGLIVGAVVLLILLAAAVFLYREGYFEQFQQER